jgi:hypothetical protein
MRCFLLSITFLSLRRFKSSGGDAHRRGFFLSDSPHETGQLRRGSGQAVPGTFALTLGEPQGELVPLPEAATRKPGDVLQGVQQELSLAGLHRLLLKLLLATQVQQGLGEQPFSDLRRPPTPGVVELLDLPCAESVLGGHVGQTFAVLATLARQGHQGFQCSLHREPPCPNMLLHRLRQDEHQRKSLRHPARAAVKALGKLLQPQPKAALKLGQKPADFERAGALGHLKRPGQHQGIFLRKIPANGSHDIASKPAQSAQALVAVDHHEALLILGG